MEGGSVLLLDGVSHSYRDTRALDDVSLTVAPGLTALVGANGAGKSTLLSSASGGLRPLVGRITIGGLDLYDRRSR